jgi:hypothetical protein
MRGGDESWYSRFPKPPWKFSNEAHLFSCVRFKLANFVCGFSLLNFSNFREVHFNATFNLSLSLSLSISFLEIFWKNLYIVYIFISLSTRFLEAFPGLCHYHFAIITSHILYAEGWLLPLL